MTRPAAQHPLNVAPLFLGEAASRHLLLGNQCEALRQRIAALPPHSHKRVALETRLQAIVLEMLTIELQTKPMLPGVAALRQTRGTP